MAKKRLPTEEDIGAAMMAWYQESLEKCPDGLVSQAQAATMLGVSRVAVNRLISRGHLRAVYFPKPPDVEGFAVGHDDPFWVKLLGWLGGEYAGFTFPKAVYVSFGNVVDLWQAGDVSEKCKMDWKKVFEEIATEELRFKRQKKVLSEKLADSEAKQGKQG